MPARAKQGAQRGVTSSFGLRLPTVPEFAGALRVPRPRLAYPLGYPPPPPGFVNSLAEWVVMYYLTTARAILGNGPNLRLLHGVAPVEPRRSFFYQISPPVLGVFSRTEATRVDFLCPGFGSAGYQAVAIDPYNEYTHPDVGLDYAKRNALAIYDNTQLIWIHTSRLENGDFAVIEEALQGGDSSPRHTAGQ